MIIPVLLVIGIIIGSFFIWLEGSYNDHAFSSFWFCCGFTVTMILTIVVITGYTENKSELQVIDQKIEVARSNNEERVNTVLPILNKYPEIEEKIISNIKPEAFAVLGDVYPKLKSNESYNAQAKIIIKNISQIEELQISKLDKQKEIIKANYYLFFLN